MRFSSNITGVGLSVSVWRSRSHQCPSTNEFSRTFSQGKRVGDFKNSLSMAGSIRSVKLSTISSQGTAGLHRQIYPQSPFLILFKSQPCLEKPFNFLKITEVLIAIKVRPSQEIPAPWKCTMAFVPSRFLPSQCFAPTLCASLVSTFYSCVVPLHTQNFGSDFNSTSH